MEKSPSNGEISLSVNTKAGILTQQMYRSQPKINDYCGAPGFSPEMLRQDRAALDRKSRYIERKSAEQAPEDVENDPYGPWAEPTMVAVMRSNDFIGAEADTFSYLASEYDDKIQGTDVVFELKDNLGRASTYSIDVATGTNPQNIKGKFDHSVQNGNPTLPYEADIHYCTSKTGTRYIAKGAPHFIVGVQPSLLEKAIDKFNFTADGIPEGREPDPATDFKLLSEMYEQIGMQVAVYQLANKDVRDSHFAKLGAILGPVERRLMRICGATGDTNDAVRADFNDKYAKLKKEFSGEVFYKHPVGEEIKPDKVYKNIIEETERRRIAAQKVLANRRGNKISAAMR